MANATITKGSKVEVSNDEPGFYGAWYVATVVDEVDSSPTKKRGSQKKNVKKIRFLVKYDTLGEEDDTSQPLTEVVDPSFVRPSPPRNIRRNNGGNATELVVKEDGEGVEDFEVNDVVDAYHREGWWIGVVKSVIVDGEMRKYVVLFENPTEEFEFERCMLRFHVDWIDRRWIIPPKKRPDHELVDKNASHDVEDKTISFPTSAKMNTRSRKRNESNSAPENCVTSSRNKRVVKLVEDDSRVKRFQSSTGSKGNKKVRMSALELETSESDMINQDLPRVEHEIIIRETRESVNGKRYQRRKSGRTPKLVIKKPIGSLQDGHGVTTDIDEQPLSVWFEGMHPLSLSKRRSGFSPCVHSGKSPNQSIVTSGGTTANTTATRTITTTTTTANYQKDWPFIKRSPIWTLIEPLELYLSPPQKPHFTPLKKMKEDCREGLAVAHMVTFGNIVQRLSDFQPSDPADVINNSLETLSELETHGFDVGPLRARLNKLLLLKTKVQQHEDTRKKVEKEIEKRDKEKSLVEKEIGELKVKMQELKEKMVQNASMMKTKEGEIKILQTNLHVVTNQITDLEVAFGKLAATPL